MNQTFAPKWDAWLVVVLAGSAVVCGGVIVLVLQDGTSVVNVSIVVLLLALGVVLPLSFVWPGVRYTLRDEGLDIRSGLFRWRISYATLEGITPAADDWRSSPATSFDRLRIEYRVGAKQKHLLVSPLDRQGFLEALAARAPGLRPEGEPPVRSERVR